MRERTQHLELFKALKRHCCSRRGQLNEVLEKPVKHFDGRSVELGLDLVQDRTPSKEAIPAVGGRFRLSRRDTDSGRLTVAFARSAITCSL